MASKYWIGNEPSSNVTSAQAKKIAADPASAIVDITDSTGGVASDTIADTAGAAPTTAEFENAVASISAKLNSALAALRAHGIIAE